MLTAPAPFRAAAPVLLLALGLLLGETKLKESDHKGLGKLVAAFFTAKSDEKGIEEAKLAIFKQIEATEKRLKGAKVLASVADLEQIFRIATEERLKETLRKKGEVSEQKQKVGDLEVSFAYCVPKKPAKGALPLILVACGEGETPSGHLNTHWNDPALREAAVLMAVDLGKDTQSWGVFGTPSAPGGTFQLMTALNVIQREFQVDHNRRFLVGSGKGFAAVEVTAASFPHVFAGVIGIGDVALADISVLDNFRALPSLFLKGGEGVKAIEAKLKELEFANCKSEPEGGVAQAWEWISKTQRDSNPAHVTFVPKDDRAGRFYWLSIVGFQASDGPRLEAKADRASNTITIDAQKISNVVVFLNDDLADLDKPVKFMLNGTAHERMVERNPVFLLENQFAGGDWGRIFTAFVQLN